VSALGSKIENISMIQDLFQRGLFDPDQLDIPDFVIEHDKRVNKSKYASQPNQAIGSEDL
jgi:hypothetical protein